MNSPQLGNGLAPLPSVSVTCTDPQAELTSESTVLEDGLTVMTVMVRQEPGTAFGVRLKWSTSTGTALAYWHPDSDKRRRLLPTWASSRTVSGMYYAPVGVLYDEDARTVEAWTLSEVRDPVTIRAGIDEETSWFRHELDIDAAPTDDGVYRVSLLIDRRMLSMAQSLRDIGKWHAVDTLDVPELAYLPLYSTWYAFHTKMSQDDVAAELAEATDIGCGTAIVDHGWQAPADTKDFQSAGDWEVNREKFPDPTQLSLPTLFWVALAYIGRESRAWDRFSSSMLNIDEGRGIALLDPRDPDVRAHLIDCCCRVLRDYQLHGLKLDFICMWARIRDTPPPPSADTDRIDIAVDRLLTDLLERVREIRPDILIEFRQRYMGPLMWRYANMFRAGDCPADRLDNRVRTVDLRLLMPAGAVHSDMITWDSSCSPEAAANHLLASLFAVPQISVRLTTLPAPAHRAVRHWIGFLRQHRKLLLTGEIEVTRPDAGYPIVRARQSGTTIIGCYEPPTVVRIGAADGNVILVNATQSTELIVHIEPGHAMSNTKRIDCQGSEAAGAGTLTGLHILTVPSGGYCVLTP